MKNEILTGREIAIAFADELVKRLAGLPDFPGGGFNAVRCQTALILGPPLIFSDQHLFGSADDLMKICAPQLDELAELIKVASGGSKPVFLTPPELPGGLVHSERVAEEDIAIRYVRGYDIRQNRYLASIDCRVLGLKWFNEPVVSVPCAA